MIHFLKSLEHTGDDCLQVALDVDGFDTNMPQQWYLEALWNMFSPQEQNSPTFSFIQALLELICCNKRIANFSLTYDLYFSTVIFSFNWKAMDNAMAPNCTNR